jgi:hypothetical protein
MIFDEADAPLSREDAEAAIKKAKDFLRHEASRAGYVLLIFTAACASVVPFSKGMVLASHAEIGRILVYLSMGLLIPAVICVARVFSAWTFLRDVKKLHE